MTDKILAERIAQQAPLGVQTHGTESALKRLRGKLLRLMLNRDARRGIAAFKARKPAEFFGN